MNEETEQWPEAPSWVDLAEALMSAPDGPLRAQERALRWIRAELERSVWGSYRYHTFDALLCWTYGFGSGYGRGIQKGFRL